MKKNNSGHYKNEEISNPFFFICFFILAFCPSCFLMKESEIEASVDAAFQEFCGPSYPEASCDELALAMNIGAILYLDPWAFTPSTTMIDDIDNPYLLASTSNLISAGSYHNTFAFSDQVNALKPATSFRDNIRLMGGLELVNKKSNDGDTKVNLIYLEIPLYAIYQKDLAEGQIFGGLGPYFAYGIGGNIKDGFTGNKYHSFDKDTGYRPFDFGIDLTAGYRLKNGFRFRLAYDRGIANLERANGGNKAKNRAYSVNLSYPLNKLTSVSLKK
ncbi:MAG: outer membrane beta-barrel protein [Saprospiraceae bacterium]